MNITQARHLLENAKIGTFLITSVPRENQGRWIASAHLKCGYDEWEDLKYRPAYGHARINDCRSLAPIIADPEDPFEPQFIWSLS